MSQERLGEALGLTFQQVQKYERGVNRIGASRLYDLARVLEVEIAFFFEELSADAARAAEARRLAQAVAADPAPAGRDPLTRRETLELVRAYYRIDNPVL